MTTAVMERDYLEAHLESMLAGLRAWHAEDMHAFRRWWWEEVRWLEALSYMFVGDEEDEEGETQRSR